MASKYMGAHTVDHYIFGSRVIHRLKRKQFRGIVQACSNPLQTLHDGLSILVGLGGTTQVTGEGLKSQLLASCLAMVPSL